MATNTEIRAALDDGGPIISLDAADVRRLLDELDAVRQMAQRWFEDRHGIGYDSSEQWQIETEGNCGQAILDALGEDQ